MALINCKECNQEISEKAKECPKCGYKNKSSSGCLNFIGYLVFFIFVIIFLNSIFGGETSENNSDYSNSNNVTTDTRTYSTRWRSPQGLEYRDIGRIMVANQIKVCGEYYLKEVENNEYIIACTADGTNWNYFIVYTNQNKIYKANDEMISQLSPPR